MKSKAVAGMRSIAKYARGSRSGRRKCDGSTGTNEEMRGFILTRIKKEKNATRHAQVVA